MRNLLHDPELDDRLPKWKFHYDWQRPHGALGGKPSIEVACDLLDLTHFRDDVHALYDPAIGRIR